MKHYFMKIKALINATQLSCTIEFVYFRIFCDEVHLEIFKKEVNC